jgi:hypothetical protein
MIGRRSALAVVVTLALAATGLATAARAQTIGQDALGYLGTFAFSDSEHTWDQKTYGAGTVQEHLPDGFMPTGYQLPNGDLLFPTITASETYDDNLFQQPTSGRVADWRSSLATSLDYRPNMQRNLFAFHADANDVTFRNNPNLDFVNANAKIDWNINIDAADTIGGTFQVQYGHDEDFLPIEPQNPARALPDLSTKAAIGYAHDAGRTSVSTGLDIERNIYANVPSYGGPLLDEHANDNTIAGAFADMNYRWSPGYRLFAAVRADRQVYMNERSAFNNNDEYTGEVGLVYERDPLLQFTSYSGYQYINFDNSNQANIGSPTFKIALQWLPTQRMTVNFDATQQLQRTLNGPEFGDLSDQVHARLRYDIWHNIDGVLDATYQDNQYIGSKRVDKTLTASAIAEYFINENLALTLSYQHEENASNETQNSFVDNRYMVALKLSQ